MVSVDAVYQKVLAIANKEQRGYITPQEFNLFADHAQKDIFRQYFYDLSQFKRRPGNNSTQHDVVDMLKEKTQIFNVNSFQFSSGDTLPPNTYWVGDCWLTSTNVGYDGTAIKVEQVDQENIIATQAGPLTRATKNRPIFFTHHNQIYTSPTSYDPAISGFHYRLQTIRKPHSPNWTYVIVGESAMFDDSVAGFMDFEIHPSEETLLVIKILQLAGINIKDPQLVQLASQDEVKKIQQEKQ